MTQIKNTSREYTTQEILEKFSNRTRNLIKYWATLDINPEYIQPGETEIHYRLEGLAHSIMAGIDGCAIDIPGFMLIPVGTTEDRDFHISEEENYYPITDHVDSTYDIAGGLRYNIYDNEEDTLND